MQTFFELNLKTVFLWMLYIVFSDEAALEAVTESAKFNRKRSFEVFGEVSGE